MRQRRCALLNLALLAFAASATPTAWAFPGLPRPPIPYQIAVSVVGLAPDTNLSPHEQLEAEMAAENELWNGREDRGTPGLVTLAQFAGPTVLHFPVRLALPGPAQLSVTLVGRDRRRVRVRVAQRRGEEASSRVIRFQLNRSYRPAEGRVVVPLGERRWLRLWLRRP